MYTIGNISLVEGSPMKDSNWPGSARCHLIGRLGADCQPSRAAPHGHPISTVRMRLVVVADVAGITGNLYLCMCGS